MEMNNRRILVKEDVIRSLLFPFILLELLRFPKVVLPKGFDDH
jgi:hypothetical protein